MPKISVIAPVYCAEQYLKQFLDSIRQQTFQDYEVILVDDGSCDHSPAILDQYAESEPRAIVIHKENGGVSSARNVGLDLAKGKYVYIVDSDDWLESTALETMWKEAERTGADVIYGAFVVESGRYGTTCKPFSRAFSSTEKNVINEIQTAVNYTMFVRTECELLKPMICHGGAPWRGMFLRSIIEDYGVRYNENLRAMGEDVLFSQELLEFVSSVTYTESIIYHYRQLDSSLSHGYKPDIIHVFQKAFDEEEQFLRCKQKGKEHWEAYYIRVIQYIERTIDGYFMNKENKKREMRCFVEFKHMLKSEPYCSALHRVPLKRFASRRFKIKVLLLRCGLASAFWTIMKYKRRRE
jgi:glycosyltransferase involved in cell wall biosynthesis